MRQAGEPRLSGPIQLVLPDRHLFGFAELEVSFAADVGSAEELWTSHTWGPVRATFEWTSCDGPNAWGFGRAPHETGGSMMLRCDDGSQFTARVVKDRYVPGTDNHGDQLFVGLEDGAHVTD